MKKRIKKIRKGIKRTRSVAKDRSAEGQGGALILYERGEIDGGGDNSAEEEIAESPHGEIYVQDTQKRYNENERRENVLTLVCGFVIVFSLFFAVVLTCFAFAVAVEYSERDIPEDIPAQESDTTGDKIIFIHTDSTGYGLTAPEIYEKCVASSVSIETSFKGGDRGIGSGFVLTEDGYIATAAHVVESAESVSVMLWGGQRCEARVVSVHTLSDIALLKIETEQKLCPVELGDSSQLLVGERVYVIGTPAEIGYAGSLTSGEISCAVRTLSVMRDGVEKLEKRLKVIQINAQVNKGNSGSPLFDTYGRVVGMVAMRLGADYNGIAFALPSAGLTPILEAMIEGRELDTLLVSAVVELPARLGISCHADESDGVYGCRIDTLDTAALSAGALKAGDLIVQIDNKLVTSPSDLSTAIGQKNAGDKVRVTLIRMGQKLTFDIILGS